MWPHGGTKNGYHHHDNHTNGYQHQHYKRSPNTYCAKLSDSVPNLSGTIIGSKKQSISHGDLVQGNRFVGRSESIDRHDYHHRVNKLLSKPPIYEKLNRNGPLLLLEEREMPITRDRQLKSMMMSAKRIANGAGGTNDSNKMSKMNSSANLLRANSNDFKHGFPSDRLRIR